MSTIKKNTKTKTIKLHRRSTRVPAIAEPRNAAVFANINLANQAAEDKEIVQAIKQHERKGMAIDPDYVESDNEEDEDEHKDEPADTPLVFPEHDDVNAALLQATRAYSTLAEFGGVDQRITAQHQDKLVLLDVEFANLEGDSPIVQLAAISVDGTSIIFNEYARHGSGKLHADWEELIQDHCVKRDPWDDPDCDTFDKVFGRFVDMLQPGSILLSKGNIDIDRMQKTLSRLPQSQAIHAVIAAKQIRFLSIDRFWFSLCSDLLPDFLRQRVMTARGSMAAQLGRIFDDTMYKPVLVFIHGALDKQEEVVDMDIAQSLFTQNASKLGASMQIEWGVTKRMAPVWHTAHTDVLVMLAISNLLITYAFMRLPLLQLVIDLKAPASIVNRSIHDLTREEIAFALLATRVALDTKWLREKTLLLSDAGGSYMWQTCSALVHPENGKTTKVRGLLSDLIKDHALVVAASAAAAVPLPPDDDGVPAVAAAVDKHKNNAPSIMLARKKRLALPEGVAVMHKGAGEWHRVYKPIVRGADAMKVRALKLLVGAGAAPAQDKTVFERLERLRGEAGAQGKIGMKPHWYMIRAVGASGPGVITLHSRSCMDSYNGNDYGEEKDASSDAVSFIDFNALPKGQGPIGFSCKFCKNCKLKSSDVAKWPDAPSADPLLSVVLSLFMLRRLTPSIREPPPLRNFLFYAGDEPPADELEALRVEHGLDAVSHLDDPTWAGPDDLLCLFTHELRDTEVESFLLQFEEIEVCRKLLFGSNSPSSSVAAWQKRGLLSKQ